MNSYICNSCKRWFESNDDDLDDCPFCGGLSITNLDDEEDDER